MAYLYDFNYLPGFSDGALECWQQVEFVLAEDKDSYKK